MIKAVKSVKCMLAIALLGAMVYSPVRGQSLQRYLNDHQYTHIQAIEYSDSSLFVLTQRESSNPLYSQEATLYKLDNSLNTIDSLQLSTLFTELDSLYFLNTNDMAIDSNGYVYVQSGVRENSSNPCPRPKISTAIFKLSPDLQLVNSIRLGTKDSSFQSHELSLEEGHLYSYGVFHECRQGSLYFAGSLIKVSQSLNSTQFYFYDADTLNTPVRPTFRWGVKYKNSHIINMFNNGFSMKLLDSNLLYKGSCTVYDSSKLSGVFFSDFRLKNTLPGELGMFGVTSTEYSSPQLHYNVGFKRVDPMTCTSTIDTFPFLGAVDFDDAITPWLKSDCFTKHSNDSLLFAVTGHSDPFITEDSATIFFYNYNFEQGRLNWMKKMESPYFVWPHVALEALPDGRYVVGLTEFNPDRYPQYARSLAGRLMIIDAQGQALDNREIRPAPKQNWSLFPNPATNSVRIKGLPQRPHKLQYTLYNTLGQAVQEGSLTTDHPHIQLPVPTGLYHLKLRHPQARLGSRALQVVERR